ARPEPVRRRARARDPHARRDLRVRRSALSPRGASSAFPDLASRGRLIGGQRIDRHRFRRRMARRARRLPRRIGAVLVVAALLGASGSLLGWLLRLPRFAIASVEVRGQSRLSREEIEAAADIAPGTNIFALDSQDVVTKLEALPLVRHASV